MLSFVYVSWPVNKSIGKIRRTLISLAKIPTTYPTDELPKLSNDKLVFTLAPWVWAATPDAVSSPTVSLGTPPSVLVSDDWKSSNDPCSTTI